MGIAYCDNCGKFYNPDTLSSCPYCGSNRKNPEQKDILKELVLEVPETVDRDSYLKGYAQGVQDERSRVKKIIRKEVF